MKLLCLAALAVMGSTAHADVEPTHVTRIRAVLPFSGFASYHGDLRDGASVSLLGISVSHERDALVLDGGVRGIYTGAGLGMSADLRAGGRTPLGGPVDLVGLAGLRYLSYEPGGDGYSGNEKVLAATAAGALELSRRHARGVHFTLRLIVTASQKLAREVSGGAVKGGAFGFEQGFDGGIELGAAL
jgi:hypothetical protein